MVLLAFLGISYLYFAVKALTVKEAGWMVPEGRWWLPGLPMLALSLIHISHRRRLGRGLVFRLAVPVSYTHLDVYKRQAERPLC